MATGAIHVFMPHCQWEKVVIDAGSLPFEGKNCMAFTTISGITSLCVIGIRRGIVIIAVTIDAVRPKGVKTEICFAGMAFKAIGHLVGAN
jgi:hypothetical protein